MAQYGIASFFPRSLDFLTTWPAATFEKLELNQWDNVEQSLPAQGSAEGEEELPDSSDLIQPPEGETLADSLARVDALETGSSLPQY